MKLTRLEQEMLDGRHGEPKRVAMDGLVQLGEAVGAGDMVEIGYAHVHPGMALYKDDVEYMERLAANGWAMAVPASSNVINADIDNWEQTGAPEGLVELQARVRGVHKAMGIAGCVTCTPYWAGHWPTWNTHAASIESGVTVFLNSVLGARTNRDGFFAVYAGVTGRYPRFGYHLEENRRGSLRVRVEASLEHITDFSALGYHVGPLVGSGVPVFEGFETRPGLDDLDALGAALATSGGVSMFIVPGITPPYADGTQAFGGRPAPEETVARDSDLAAVYEAYGGDADTPFDIVQLGCPHASYEEMKLYARLLGGRRVHETVTLWVTTSRYVRDLARRDGLAHTIEASGAKIVADTCPIECHFIRTGSPDPSLGVKPVDLKGMVVDSTKMAKYVRDMVGCRTFLSTAEGAVDSAVTGRFVGRPFFDRQESGT